MSIETSASGKTVFGVPAVLTGAEANSICQIIEGLWQLTYRAPVGQLASDLDACRIFFDPALRGLTLRKRIDELPSVPSDLRCQINGHLQTVVVDVGEGKLLVGVEARLVLELLRQRRSGNQAIIPSVEILAAHEVALSAYRAWARHRLDQVVALRTGQGDEVIQAPSVGVVLALLVNRSTSPERAVMRPSESGTMREAKHPVDDALHSAAIAFADSITTGRRRSAGEQRLTGGYILSEARRRLGNHLVITKAREGKASLLYIDPDRRDEVVAFLAVDLARRPGLTIERLTAGFDNLTTVFRERAVQLARHRVIFERPADTARLRQELLDAFAVAKSDTHEM